MPLRGREHQWHEATDICHTFCSDSSVVLVPRHRREVCPLARRVMLPKPRAQPISTPLQGGIRFFPPPYPHHRRLVLRLSSLPFGRNETGLPRSTRLTVTGEVLSMRRERYVSMTGERPDPGPATVPLWPKPLRIFGLPEVTTCIERSHMFTIPSIQPHLRLMLAETPSPHGSGASRMTVGTVSEGSVRVVTFPHIFVGYC